jgi:DNA polymerase I-like protein with 3'-5' exonuclease and polymerase domains
MIVNCDAKALEWVVGTYLSQDPVAFEEIWNNVDQHTLNQEAFKLPSRLIAKTFVFRLMYGGSAYSYANDPDFTGVSKSVDFWQFVIDSFYNKYKGFAKWHEEIVKGAMSNGYLIMPTGRVYEYDPIRDYKGNLKAPETIIKNYPVQGLGADIMAIARVEFAKRFYEENIRGVMVNTIHDSIVCDIDGRDLDKCVALFNGTFFDIPMYFKERFGVEFNLPLRCEVSYGDNMKELTEVQ